MILSSNCVPAYTTRFLAIMEIIQTVPIEGQKTGTSGLRKKVKMIQATPNYIENWLQSLMNALEGSQAGSAFVIGGDGRYLNDFAIQCAIEILAANNVHRIIVGRNGLLSTPAVSNIIRRRKLFGGIILTASHNPAGIDGDWGIKFNSSNGEPAPEKVTDKIYTETMKIREIKRVIIPKIDLNQLGEQQVSENCVIEVIDSVEEYANLMKKIFDLPQLSKFLNNHKIVFDGMHAVTGIYARRIFVEELGLSETRNVDLTNCDPSQDFHGGHPDPNLVYAHDLVAKMMSRDCGYVFGAASDGDGDRNMIMGKNWFVTPSDSLAIIADYAAEGAIPYFVQKGLKGVARSMPTSRAIDAVCEGRKLSCFETPTGWKYFGNLMDAGLVNLCGEESFGTGSDHIREKDGIWAVLAWLSILEYVNRGDNNTLVGVRAINERHWDKYGRHMYCRFDYEEVDSNGANDMMNHIRKQMPTMTGTEILEGWRVTSAQEYNYIDPVDKSEAKKQGLIICFENGSRLVYRLSGTGSAGATIRVYMEYYVKNWRLPEFVNMQIAKSPLRDIGAKISDIERYTGRANPSVIT